MTSRTMEGKVAVVSGSSSGIGAAICRELSSRGAIVVVNYPWPSLESEAARVLESCSGRGIIVEADLSTRTGPAELIAATVAVYPEIYCLVNNAAIAVNKSLEDSTLEDFDSLVNLNCRGTFLLTQSVLPHLSRPSRIINIVSATSRGSPPLQTIYSGTKGMTDCFTKVWAKELPPKYGCTVNAVSPGPTMTEGFAAAGEEAMKVLQSTIDMTPVGPRLGEPEEIAYAVAVLAEERARWMNGVHLHANGGLLVD